MEAARALLRKALMQDTLLLRAARDYTDNEERKSALRADGVRIKLYLYKDPSGQTVDNSVGFRQQVYVEADYVDSCSLQARHSVRSRETATGSLKPCLKNTMGHDTIYIRRLQTNRRMAACGGGGGRPESGLYDVRSVSFNFIIHRLWRLCPGRSAATVSKNVKALITNEGAFRGLCSSAGGYAWMLLIKCTSVGVQEAELDNSSSYIVQSSRLTGWADTGN